MRSIFGKYKAIKSDKPVKVAESVVLAQGIGLCTALAHQGKLDYFRVSTVGIPRGNFKNGTGRFSKNKSMEGFSDLLILLPMLVLFAEAKSERGVLSEAQTRFKERVEKMGHKYHVFRSCSQLETILQTYGVETRTWVRT